MGQTDVDNTTGVSAAVWVRFSDNLPVSFLCLPARTMSEAPTVRHSNASAEPTETAFSNDKTATRGFESSFLTPDLLLDTQALLKWAIWK